MLFPRLIPNQVWKLCPQGKLGIILIIKYTLYNVLLFPRLIPNLVWKLCPQGKLGMGKTFEDLRSTFHLWIQNRLSVYFFFSLFSSVDFKLTCLILLLIQQDVDCQRFFAPLNQKSVWGGSYSKESRILKAFICT